MEPPTEGPDWVTFPCTRLSANLHFDVPDSDITGLSLDSPSDDLPAARVWSLTVIPALYQTFGRDVA